ncbi:MAG: translation initiation factor IF-2 [Firmicutes bacterium]|nr:translation initiation factor IF-2 [Bacillota bacterium]
MAKLRIEDVAKKLNVPAQMVMKKLEEIGIFASNAQNTLSQEEVLKVVELITGKKPKVRAKTAPKAEKPAATAVEKPVKKAVPAEEKPAEEKPVEKPAEKPTEKPAETVEKPKKEKAPKTEDKPVEVPVEKPVEKPADKPAEKPEEKPAAAEAAEEKTLPKTEETKEEKPVVPAEEKEDKPAVKPAAKAAAASQTPAASAGRKLEGEIVRTADGRLVRRVPIVQTRRVADGTGSTRSTQSAQSGTKTRTQQSGTTAKPQGGAGRGTNASQSTRGADNRPQNGRRDQAGTTGGTGRTGADTRRTGFDRKGQDQGMGGKDRMPERPARSGNAARGQQAGGARRSGSDSYDMGLSAPKAKTENKDSRKQNERKKGEKQRNTATEEYKNKKKSLSQEKGYLDDDRLARHKKKPVKRPGTNTVVEEEDIKIVQLPDSMTVKEFADMLHKPINQIIKALMGKGIMAGLNQIIEYEQAEEIATEMDILVEHQEEEDIFAKYASFTDAEEDLKPRSPVVVVMGHVDHGKTSLLDAIRDTHVTAREAGGITQHIGASVVTINDREITFLDTPGHEAFTAMRMRGAQVTDIAILVVAADDGVMPQTIEAINHAKAAGVQIIVAINKMDKAGANPDRVKQELTEYELIPEDWGGSTICVPVSAIKKEGIDTLLEMVLLVADMQELKANPDALASGTVIESELDKGRGAVATVLVQRGTLHVGDTIVAGSCFGRIKAMVDDQGRRVREAGPSMPVEIIGLSEVPQAGDSFYMTETDREARTLAEKVAARDRIKLMEGNKRVNLNDLFGDIQAGEVKELNILVKADVQGSVEAVKQSLEKLSNDQVAVRVIHGAVGAVNESDVMLASASNSIIIGFNVRPDAAAKSMAEEQKVDIRLYRVIYNAIDDIEAAMKGLLDPEFQEKILGHAQVRQIFHASGVGTIAGSYVTDGKIMRNSSARIVRDGIVVHEGPLASLRRFKDDVREVATGYECGIMFEKYNDVKEGDVIEAFTMEEIKRD